MPTPAKYGLNVPMTEKRKEGRNKNNNIPHKTYPNIQTTTAMYISGFACSVMDVTKLCYSRNKNILPPSLYHYQLPPTNPV